MQLLMIREHQLILVVLFGIIRMVPLILYIQQIGIPPEDPVVEKWGNGWYCFRIFILPENVSCTVQLVFGVSNSGWVYGGTNSEIAHVAHYQLCKGKYRHSLIKTAGAAVTRNALVT